LLSIFGRCQDSRSLFLNNYTGNDFVLFCGDITSKTEDNSHYRNFDTSIASTVHLSLHLRYQMSDIKDIMGIPRGSGGSKVEKTKSPKMKKPKGMSREAFALLSASHPLMPSELMGEIEKDKSPEKKERRGKVSFEWRKFTNPCRSDDLELYHWVKCYTNTATNSKIIPAEEEYPFQKFSKQVQLFRYDDDEWNNLITQDKDWSREETDYLLDLVEQMDMRWLPIADRYEFSGKDRSVDDIKGRYYSIARQLLIGREGGVLTTIANNPLVKTPFDPEHEKRRKAGYEQYLIRNPDKEAEEDDILAQAAKIEAKRKAEEGKSKGNGVGATSVASRLQEQMIDITEFEVVPPVGTPPLFDAQGNPAMPTPVEGTKNTPGCLLRVLHTKDLIDAQIESLNEQRDMLLRLLNGVKLEDLPRAANRAVCGAYLTLIKEALEYLELRRNVEAKQILRKRFKSEDADDEDPSVARSEKRQKISLVPGRI